jgi:hypothetical protein
MAIFSPGTSADNQLLVDGTGLQAMFPFNPNVGTCPNPAKAVVYTVPKGYKTVVASIEIFNNSGGVANVTVYLNTNGSDLPLRGAALNALDALVDTLPRSLPVGTTISIISDVGNCTYVIQLMEAAT